MTTTRILLLLCTLGLAASQYLTPPLLGTNYQTDDASRQEVISEDGTVQGQYSYVDPSGKPIHVRYTAGKDGFKIVGQHVPERILLLLGMLGLAASQYLTPPLLGTNYQTDDASRQEVISEDGTVQGQYSYVDPSGKPIHVRYTAGKDGFKIVGQHVPEIPDKYQPTHFNAIPDLQGYQSQSVYDSSYQPRFTQALFTPAEDAYPAHTAGQVKMMQEYLEEERMELEKERQKGGDRRQAQAQSHVSVQGPSRGYEYNIEY